LKVFTAASDSFYEADAA